MKYLFVGLGGVGQRHLRNLTKLISADDEILAYRVRKEQSVISDKLQILDGERLEDKYKIRSFDSLAEALDAEPDAVFICNPSSMHMEIMLETAERGIPFFVEKPLSHNLDGMDQLVRLCRKNNVISYVGYQQRNNPCIVKAKSVIQEGVLGDILSINAEIGERVTEWHKYEDYRRMYACRSDMGGGVVLSQIHELDYLYWFLGMPTSVYAIGGKYSDLEIDVEDTVDILLKHELNGRKINVHIHEDYVQNPPSRTCKVVGTKGKLEFDLINLDFRQYDISDELVENEHFDFERNSMFEKELVDFLDCVKNNKQSQISVEEGLKSLKIALAIKESLEKDIIVKL